MYEQLVPLLCPELHDVQVLDAELLGKVTSHPHVVWGASIYNVFDIIKRRQKRIFDALLTFQVDENGCVN